MRITTGKVRDGAIDLEGEVLPEGSIVTVIARDDEATLGGTQKRLRSIRRRRTRAAR